MGFSHKINGLVGSERKYAVLLLLTVTICVLALYIHRHRQGKTGRVDSFLLTLTGALQKNVFFLGKGTKSVVDNYVLLMNTKKKNEELQAEVDVLRTRLASLQEVDSENQRLRDQLDFRKQLNHQLIASHVVAHDVSADYAGIRIDKGKDDGVEPGMGVISTKGLVGRVLRVSGQFSDVLTINDPTSNVDVIVQRSRVRGILSGQPKQTTLKVKYIDRLDDVQVNDLIISSDFGHVFPKGLLVGYVTQVIPNPTGVVQGVVVQGAVDIYRLEEVFVVFPAGAKKVS